MQCLHSTQLELHVPLDDAELVTVGIDRLPDPRQAAVQVSHWHLLIDAEWVDWQVDQGGIVICMTMAELTSTTKLSILIIISHMLPQCKAGAGPLQRLDTSC